MTVETPLSARELFEELSRKPGFAIDEYWAEDVVIEQPFALPPRRTEGRANFLAAAVPGRAALPVRFDGIRDPVVHETVDPELIIVEFRLAGTITTTGRSASAPFVVVLRVRDGKIVLWREYQNVALMTELLGELG
ncbi:nuclear transport factor 2 family protein [Amycolatopsis nigrescens]|uniref:nuclear transport factor 2 family protein n=1 Tax=Amycolatopsis nigrescens TaxID=381445 RepID=UPI00036FD76A|nr:nuclear transport factor 2 family protein [Amycolatopsis nigrescens]